MWHGTVTPSYRLGPVSFSWMARFVSAMRDQGVVTGAIPVTNPLGYKGTPNYVVNDLTLGWQGDSNHKPYVMLGVNNVFDKIPPFAAVYIGTRMYNTLPSTYDVIGRYFFLNAGYKF